MNGHTPEKGDGEKSKTATLDEQQMIELENQLVMKIMSHFKGNFNYPPPLAGKSEDVFYSPIGERTNCLFRIPNQSAFHLIRICF